MQHATAHRRRHRRRRGARRACAALNAGAEPLGSFGAVVGATIGDTGETLDINGPLLAPGYGAQGGTAADIRRIFGAASRRASWPARRASCSRSGRTAAALRDGVRRANDDLAGARRMRATALPRSLAAARGGRGADGLRRPTRRSTARR